MRCKTLRRHFNLTLNRGQELAYTPEMQKHLDGCPACKDYIETALKIESIIRNLPEVELPPELEHFDETIIAINEYCSYGNIWREALVRLGVQLLILAATWGVVQALPFTGGIFVYALIMVVSIIATLMTLPKVKYAV
jgi:hypothetical protein